MTTFFMKISFSEDVQSYLQLVFLYRWQSAVKQKSLTKLLKTVQLIQLLDVKVKELVLHIPPRESQFEILYKVKRNGSKKGLDEKLVHNGEYTYSPFQTRFLGTKESCSIPHFPMALSQHLFEYYKSQVLIIFLLFTFYFVKQIVIFCFYSINYYFFLLPTLLHNFRYQ